MKQIDNIAYEMIKDSTGIFKNENGTIWYLLNGNLHRSDGPAIEYSNGTKRWYLYGYIAISKEQWLDPSWRKKIEIKVFI